MATFFADHILGPDTHANRPAAGDVPQGTLYSCSDHDIAYQSDGASTWTDWLAPAGTAPDHNHTAGGGDGGDLDSPIIDGYAVFNEESTPGSADSGTARLYAKSDGRFYSIDDAGNEFGPFDTAGGGGGPLLYPDSLALHASGDDMDDDTLAAWTLGGGLTTADVTAVLTEPYDDTCLDIRFSAVSDRMLRSMPGDGTYIMSIHGLTNSTPNSVAAAGRMMSLCIVDSAGDGTGISLYDDGGVHVWNVDNYAYLSTFHLSFGAYSVSTLPAAAASNFPIYLRLVKSGTSVTGGFSFNGLAWKNANTKTDSVTHDRYGIISLFSGGGTDPTIRVGRMNIL